MAAPYLEDLEQLMKSALASDLSVDCKHFFSGAAAYIDGLIFVTLSPVGLALKMSDERCVELLNADAVPLRYFESSPVKVGYVLFEDPKSMSFDRIAALLSESIAYVRLGA